MALKRLDPLTPGGKVLVEQGKTRVHVSSPLMMESLMDKGLIDRTQSEYEVPILADAQLIHLGGRSIIDRGRKALFPLIEEIVANRERHKIIIGVGGGIRERHTYAHAVDLGLPTGGLAQLVGVICKQNATMVYYLLARHGGVRVARDDFPKLPFYLEAGGIPVIVDMAPYHFWEFLPKTGRIPIHRPDSGAYLISEVYSCRSCIFVKDVDGIYTADSNTDPSAQCIPEIAANDLLQRALPDSCLEQAVPEIMLHARNSRRIQIINGLAPGNLTRALNGETVGTAVYR